MNRMAEERLCRKIRYRMRVSCPGVVHVTGLQRYISGQERDAPSQASV
ncbi:MAG TPA: hypothetical protein H9756_10755 [Candidatus Mediterraneibacter gallistercoris]|uniref:Uncharacterized protein n=1 Tax=Candidatus Mediterraneibacter gallistercoris TaxID=2838671 RepID=A0A9D2P5W4_9FIRM|nr:hypothetical protein [Candidatus Mediterraneibacter gallistercoris]